MSSWLFFPHSHTQASIPVGSSTRSGYGVHYVWIDLPLPSKGPVSLIDCDVCLGSVGF